MAKGDAEVKKALDAVVGEEFRPKIAWRVRLARWIAGACIALGVVAAIVAILHTHIYQAQTAPPPPPPPRPVNIQIVPSR